MHGCESSRALVEELKHPEVEEEQAPGGAMAVAQRVILGFGLLLLLGLVVLILYTVFGPNGRTQGRNLGINETGGLVDLNGSQADAFTLDLFTGSSIALDELRGQVVVVNFWASWCPPCRKEAPELNAAWRELQDEDVVFLGVDVWDEREDALAFIDEFDVQYPNGLDRSGTITVAYGIRGIPETYIIDREGRKVAKFVGPIEAQELVDFVQDTLSTD